MIYGISMIRNEADIVRLNVSYHLAQGIDRLLIVDNASTDGTDQVLQQISEREPRLRWSSDNGPFLPSRVMTELAREAFRDGADWVVPIDADEFWYTSGRTLRRVLEESNDSVLRAQAVNFIQRREQKKSSPEGLLYMTMRAASPIGPPDRAQDLVEAQEIAFVEKVYPQKCITRTAEEVYIETGHHSISGVSGPRRRTDEIVCLHAPIRSRKALEERVKSAKRAAEAGRNPNQGRNRRRLAELEGGSIVDLEWAANSYEGDHLDVYGEHHPVVFDPRLRDAVAPFLKPPLWKRLSWSLERLGKGSKHG